MKIYGIIDRKAKNVAAVFQSSDDEAAKRSFLMLLTGPQNVYTDFPEDFDLYQIADISFNVGVKVSAMGNENLAGAGLRVDSFEVGCPLQAGVDLDKRYLDMVRADRFKKFSERGESDASL